MCNLAVGGIIATYSFLTKDAPKYTLGYSICIAFISLTIVSSTAYFTALTFENAKRDRIAASQDSESASALTDEEKKAMGDLNPDYRYFR